jgi:hypothetical protein
MFKLCVNIDSSFKLDDPINLIELRKQYPNCYFKTGQYKNNPTLFVLGDLETREYSDPVKLKDGSTFFAPKDNTAFDLEKYETEKDLRKFKIEIQLICGRKIWIRPATMEPQAYSLFDDDNEEQPPYSQATEYGRLAYSLYDDIIKQQDIKLTDPRVKKFVKLCIAASYDMPLVVFDSLKFISASDLMPIISAGMGMNDDVLIVKKNTSDMQS